MKHRFWIALSGFIWLAVGGGLLYKGLKFLAQMPHPEQATWWMAGGLLAGVVKGRGVLAKTARRTTARIAALPLPITLRAAYPPAYWVVMGGMMGLGVALRFVPVEWRGAIDIAVGSALMHGAMVYFRAARSLVVG
jgi:hypothetical protein